MAHDNLRQSGVPRRDHFRGHQRRRSAAVENTRLAKVLDGLYDRIWSLGEMLADEGGFELPDEWPNLVRDWLLVNRPDVLDRELTTGDLQAALDAWQIGHRDEEP